MSLIYVRNAERFGGRRALVLGGSIAGLLAARVLSRHFDEVTLVERDKLPDEAAARKGAPQGQHLHALLLRGLLIMDELFPGLSAELRAGGAVDNQMGKTFRWYHGAGYLVPCEGGPRGLGMSRPFLEAALRRRVRQIENVRVIDDCDVTGLSPRVDRRGIAGVCIKRRDERRSDASAEETLSADLVIDAMGRGSRALRWLEELGYPRPEETEIHVHVGYASRVYERPEPDSFPWTALYVLGPKRIGALFAIEGGRWMSVLGGVLRDYPPDDEAGFLEFAKSLPAPDVYEMFKKEKPLSDIATYRFPSNLRRHFERLSRMPEGFCALGDAVASFNPIYGQGMTTAALGAEVLDTCLRETRRERGAAEIMGFSTKFHARLGRELDAPWFLSTSEDLAREGIKGPKPPGFAAMRAYVDNVRDLAFTDPDIVRRFYEVMHMVAPPTTLFHPSVALPVAKRALGHAREFVAARL